MLSLVALLGVGLSGCARQSMQGAELSAEEAEQHLVACMSAACDSMDNGWHRDSRTSSEVLSGVADARARIETAFAELSGARTAIEALPDSNGRRDYLAALDIYGDIAVYLEMEVSIVEAGAARARGFELIDEVGIAVASDSAGPVLPLLEDAERQFALAVDCFQRYADIEGLELQEYADNAELWRQLAEAMVTVEKSYQTGSESELGGARREADRRYAQANASVMPDTSVPLSTLTEAALQAEGEADLLRKQALEELGVEVADVWTHGQLTRYIQEVTGEGSQ